MLNGILLHLQGKAGARAAIATGVELAARNEARVRGVTLVDTRRIESLTASCESAVYVEVERGRLQRHEGPHNAARADLTQACLSAGLNFDVRRLSGDPFDVLPRESQFHDLVVAAYPPPDNDECPDEEQLTARELVALLHRGVQPLLVVRRDPQPCGRVLLAYDGSPESGRAIRSFLSHSLYPKSEYRLLSIGHQTESQAAESLRQMGDYCRSHGVVPETGWAHGSPRKVLVPYARKWDADVVVLGVTRGSSVARRLLGETALDVLTRLPCALYAAT